jgi:hypothetical protein
MNREIQQNAAKEIFGKMGTALGGRERLDTEPAPIGKTRE